MNIVKENGKTVTIINTYHDASGAAIVPKDVPMWTTDKPEAVALDPSEDGLTCGVIFVSVATEITVTSTLSSVGLTNSNVFETVADVPVIVSVTSEVVES